LETSAIERENVADPELFGNAYELCVDEVHGHVLVAFHELESAFYSRSRTGDELGTSRVDEADGCRRPVFRFPEQMGTLDQHALRRKKPAAELSPCFDTAFVIGVPRRHESDYEAGVEQRCASHDDQGSNVRDRAGRRG
jgi:hypothetical protein